MITLYSADITGNPGNCSYPHRHDVVDADSLKAAVCHDYVCAEYKNHYRNNDNFIGSDCLPVDCDNDHSEDPTEWITPDDVAAAFPGVRFAVHYSRYHNREKNSKPARPKFHILFPIDFMTDATAYSDLKKLVNTIFPYFDTQALDAARFFFGTTAAEVEIREGSMNLTDFLEDADAFDQDMGGGKYGDRVISEGSRNATMSLLPVASLRSTAIPTRPTSASSMKPPSVIRRSRMRSLRPSGAAPRSSSPVLPRRTATSLRRSTTTTPAISRRTSPTSGRPRYWQNTSRMSSGTHRPPTSSAIRNTTGRKQSPVRRRSPMS